MRFSGRSRPYLCLSCQVRTSRLYIATNRLRLCDTSQRQASFRSFKRVDSTVSLPDQSTQAVKPPHSTITNFNNNFFPGAARTRNNTQDVQNQKSEKPIQDYEQPITTIESGDNDASSPRSPQTIPSRSGSRRIAITTLRTIELSESQQEKLKSAYGLRQRLNQGLLNVPEIKKDPSIVNGMSIDDILKTLPQEGHSPSEQQLISRLGAEFSGQSFGTVKKDLDLAVIHRNPAQRKVSDPRVKDVLVRLGVVAEDGNKLDTNLDKDENQESTRPISGTNSRHQSLASMVATQQSTSKKASPKSTQPASRTSPPQTKGSKNINTQSVTGSDLTLTSVDIKLQAELPQLSFDLSRVLFNPGVYQLRDPRSRVYNFDPYLEQIMPISEFNFDALNPYLTSSEDSQLLDLARNEQTRYTGSSSSMTAVMAQFHFLISQWRELNVENFTRGFSENHRSFTTLNRSPAAIFLRYKDGIYAVDADKEYDEPNVLMSLGKSMEKLLTLEKDEFEMWRKSNASSTEKPGNDQPDVFHYSQQGRFLLRSQLDVWDPRLPGTGYFDLKTRAVAGIRMNMREHEAGMGYQIKERFGTWESYEREYYDMMRSTFLKYSLQVRMGRMDGIFVAYHNITQMFGFQYIPISEMDTALHGQSDPSIGDQEFRFSINFMEEVFNAGTQAYPNQSLRIHFEVREASVTEPKPYMNIFIEPMAEDAIKNIQNAHKAQFDAFEQKILHGEEPGPVTEEQAESENEASQPEEDVTQDDDSQSALPVNTIMSRPTGPASIAANTEFLDSILNTPRARKAPDPHAGDVMCLRLTIQNKINDRPVTRPELISSDAKWTIDYELEQLSDETARKLYTRCKNKRMAALKTVINRGSDNYFIRSIRQLSEQGAQWRKQQDELDGSRERVILYGDRSVVSDQASEGKSGEV